MNYGEKVEKFDRVSPNYISEYFSGISLSKNEIEKLFENNMLSNKLRAIFDEEVPTGDYQSSIYGENAQNAEVRMVLDTKYNPILLFTDNFLILGDKTDLKSTYREKFEKALVIPYSYILDFSISNKDSVYSWDAIVSEKKGNVAMGAIVGGAIAGTTGAIVGAINATQPKKVTVLPAGGGNDKKFNFSLTFVNEEKYTIREINDRLFAVSNINYEIQSYVRNWSYAINNVLFDCKHSFEALDNMDEALEICEEYILKFHEIKESAINFENRSFVIDYINSHTDMNIVVDKYCSNMEFLQEISSAIKNSNDEISKEILKIIDSIASQECSQIKKDKEEIKNILNEVPKLEDEYKRMSGLHFLKKMVIQEKISNLNHQRHLLQSRCQSNNYCPDVSKDIYILIRDTYLSAEDRIIELIKEKKRIDYSDLKNAFPNEEEFSQAFCKLKKEKKIWTPDLTTLYLGE